MTIGMALLGLALGTASIAAWICASWIEREEPGFWFFGSILITIVYVSAYSAGFRQGQHDTLDTVKSHGLGEVVLIDEKRVFRFKGEY